VVSSCALLLGAKLREALNFMMLGVAFAWVIGSNTALKAYASLKGGSGTFYSWIRLPLAMALAGGVCGAMLLYSRANPVLVVVFMCAAGMFFAPLTPFPTGRIWLRIPLFLVAVAACLAATWGIVSIDLITSDDYLERYGQLAVTGLFAFIVGFFWLSKGWGLIQRGICSTPSLNALSSGGSTGTPWAQYISVFLGFLVLTLWLGLLAWSASNDWAYAPENPKSDYPFSRFIIAVLLASWPYMAWKSILCRESNADPKYYRRHGRTSVLAEMMFVVVLSLAITNGIQNGNDRRMVVEKIQAVAKDLTAAVTRIGAIKQRDLRTTNDYIRAYAEIEQLLPDCEAKIEKCAVVCQEARQLDKNKSLISTQLFYKSHPPDMCKDNFELLNLIRKMDTLTKQEVLTARNMAALPEQDQAEFWRTEFRPLLVQEYDLREKIQIVAGKIQLPSK
jgi:hypothetical protein